MQNKELKKENKKEDKKEDKKNASNVLEIRKEKFESLKKLGIEPFPNDFIVKNTVDEILSIAKNNENLENLEDKAKFESKIFSVAGRIMAINKFGKSCFVRFKDRTNMMQAYIAKNEIGDDLYNIFKQYIDIGDFIGITGPIFKTHTGEWTLLAKELKIVCKALKSLPEKFHGLKDSEKRYRQRYLDLIINQDSKNIFIKRSKIIQELRNFLLERDFLEVETPMMQAIAGGAEAAPFITHHNALDMDLYLRIAPELYLKRLVVGGFERVFEINRNFRNEGVSSQHNPEFTMVEFYQAYANYEDLINLTQELFIRLALKIFGTTQINYQENIIDFGKKWEIISLLDSLEKFAGLDLSIIKDKNTDKLLEFAESKQVQITKNLRFGKIITKIFETLVEPKLIQPTFITHYPVEVSPLSRKNNQDQSIVDRFELFIAGREIANGFSELNDPIDQKERFLQQVEDRDAGNIEAHLMDEDYIEALEYGMPPTAGEGIGIDRLVMLFTNSESIREVILFPHMKNKLNN